MPETIRCPRCQSEIPAAAPEGLCPHCLLQEGFEPQTTAYTPVGSAFVPPTVEALQAAFPQLEMLELLGRGGMGAVYKARQPGLDRLVAVKILPPEVSRQPAFAERFNREARALAKLNHPNIVGVYDFGQAGGFCYFVMEYVDGVNLRQAMRAGALKAPEALKIVPQICAALQFAHDEGIVHRDIKPENILLDKKGRVKIADFGLAKLLGKEAHDVSLTGAQQVMGTLRYMAPEQLEGSRDVDHRADIYSLGVTFYEMLTGELPIGRFAAPSKKVQIDVRLDEVVLRSLEKEPEQRYQHASEIKTEVESITSSGSPAPTATRTSTPGSIPALFYLKTLALAALAWLLVPLLWNAGGWGLVGVCLAIATLVVWRARRAARYLPTTAERWRQRSSFGRWCLLSYGVLFASLGVYAAFLGGVLAWERLHWNFLSRTADEFKQEYQGAEYRLLRELPEYNKDIPRAELSLTNFRETFGWNLSIGSSPPCKGFFGTFSICVTLLFALYFFVGTYHFLLSDRSAWAWSFRWRWSALSLGCATFAPFLPYGIVLLLMSYLSDGCNGTYATRVYTGDDFGTLAVQLDSWSRQNGYVSGDFSAWDVLPVPQGAALAGVQERHYWRPNVFDRWEMTRHGLQNRSPDLAVMLIGSARTQQAVVLIRAKFQRVQAERGGIEHELDGLRQAFAP